MFLKEIRSHGFKSFADQIKIELEPGITGIVGPNGSGKSNVVDAVRWVLGEQSIKSLRGDGAMNDVIFAGSKSRNPLNVASVSLVFDNKDHYLPLDFDEVVVKRRVYKDGTNEYYINNEKVRLKDVSDLFLDSGIAKESLNIISQGKIDEVLLSKPFDRRVIFEEAAGVLKYKKRKEDALKKLDKTHDNMNRVNDIISELETQIDPLAKQVEKASEYEKASAELQELEVALLAKDITDYSAKFNANKITIDNLNNEAASLMATSRNSEALVSKVKVEILAIEKDIQLRQQELIEKTKEVEKLNGQKQLLLAKQKEVADDAKLHDNIIYLKERMLTLENDLAKIKREKDALNKSNIETSNNLQPFKQKLEEIRVKKNELNNALASYLKTKESLKARISYLKDSIDNNGLLPYAVKSVLNHPTLSGIYDVVGNVLEISDEYSLAISTSLGMSSTNIITADDISAKGAINYLKNNKIGRATFLPLSVITPRVIEENTLNLIAKEDGVVGVALNLVKYDKKYYNVIANQLGNVIVVKNIDVALKIGKLINYRYKIVTLDGNIQNVGGSLTGGNSSNVKSVILEKQELESLLKDEDNNLNKIKDIENDLNECDDLIKANEDKIYLLNKEITENDQLISTKTSSAILLEEQLDQLKNELNSTNHLLDNTITSLEEDALNKYYEALKEEERLKDELKELTTKKENAQEILANKELEIKKENSLFQENNNLLKNLEIENNRLEVRLDNALMTLNEKYKMTYERALEYELKVPSDAAKNKISSLKKTINDIGVVNLGAKEEYERIKTRYEFLEAQQSDLFNAENTLLKIISEMDEIMKQEFMNTFKVIQNNFKETFKELFHGGDAYLKLTDEADILNTGIEIIASPPGKKLKSISLLSGGEKTFTAISLLFAILKSRPVPFCILDEVEAALDESNVESFGKYLLGLKDKTQFILITHKKKMMEYANVLYGITMQESGVSKLVSVKLEEIN